MALRLWLRNSADVVCHATSQHGLFRHIWPNTLASATQYHGIASLSLQQCWRRLSCNLTTWHCNRSILFAYDPVSRHHITIQTLIGNVTCVCLCKCTNMYINPQLSKLAILHKDTFLYSHIISIIILHIKTSQCSDLPLRRETYSLQQQTSSLQRQVSTTRASLPEPTRCSKWSLS